MWAFCHGASLGSGDCDRVRLHFNSTAINTVELNVLYILFAWCFQLPLLEGPCLRSQSRSALEFSGSGLRDRSTRSPLFLEPCGCYKSSKYANRECFPLLAAKIQGNHGDAL